MGDVEIGVPSAGAGATAPLPGEPPAVTVQKVGDAIETRVDGVVVLRMGLGSAVRYADLLWEAVRS